MLQNNSKEMKTVVETFIMEETVALTYDDEQLQQWNERVKELGLKGQAMTTSETNSPNPFTYMNDTLVTVASTLCPRKEEVVDYSATPIPLEILDLIAMSVREKYFSRIEIWYDEKSKDPFAIGITREYYLKKKGTWDSHDDTTRFKSHGEAQLYLVSEQIEADIQEAYSECKNYLIGKWADVKMSFAQLTKKAKTRWVAEESLRHKRAIKEAERGLADIKLSADEKFGE
jgi:hypothetical protein